MVSDNFDAIYARKPSSEKMVFSGTKSRIAPQAAWFKKGLEHVQHVHQPRLAAQANFLSVKDVEGEILIAAIPK